MLNLEHWLRQFGRSGRQATKVYGLIVTQTRNRVFYTHYGVKDTVTGRYELLVLHMAIVLAALRNYEPVNGPLSRALVEAFVADIDDTLRELGIGDMSVPRRVKKASAGLLERSMDYLSRLQNNDAAGLAEDLACHIGMQQADASAQALAKYAVMSYQQLVKTTTLPIDVDSLTFPNPAHLLDT